jgi:outer membrane protein assembly factor BamB
VPSDVVEVVVEEGEGPGDAPDDHEVPARARARLRWAGLAVLVLLASGMATATVLDARRDAGAVAALAGQVGVLAQVDGPLEEAWRVDDGWLLAESDGAIVVMDVAGANVIRGLDPRTGQVLWSRDPGRQESCLPVREAATDESADAPLRAELLVCGSVGNPYGGGATEASTMTTVDVASGTELTSWDVGPGFAFFESADGDLVAVGFESDGAARLTRWDPRTGRAVWTHVSAPGVGDEIMSGEFWSFQVADGVVWLGGLAHVAVSLATGAPVDDAGAAATSEVRLPDGGRVVTEDGSEPHARVVDADGSVRFELAASPWVPWITDGSMPGVLMLRGSDHRISGVDARTGEQLWSADGLVGMAPGVQVDGVVVALGTSTAVGLSVADGLRLWEVEIERGAGAWSPLTDGRSVFLLTAGAAGMQLAAHDLRTGTQEWAVATDPAATYLDALGEGTLLVHTGSDLIAYR